MAASAPAASAGGNEVVKMKPGAWLRERRRAHDVAANRAEGLAEGALDHRRTVHDPVALGNAAAACPVNTDGVHQIGRAHV